MHRKYSEGQYKYVKSEEGMFHLLQGGSWSSEVNSSV